MGICGHVGVAFDPLDEERAIGAVSGTSDDPDADWVRYQAEFQLIRENYWQVHRVLETLANNDETLAPVARAVIGTRKIVEVGSGAFHLYTAQEMRDMADAFSRVTEDALAGAIAQVRAEFPPEIYGAFPHGIDDDFATVRREVTKVAEGGWAMIGGMF